MNSRHAWKTPLLAGLLLLSQPAHAQDLDRAAIKAYVDTLRERWEIPGIALAVVHSTEPAWYASSGVLGLDNPRPVDHDTLFAIGSCTKAFTAASLLMLARESEMSLDDPVAPCFTSLEFATDELNQHATLRDLLSHRTGLPGNNLMFWNANVDRETLIERVRFLTPRAPLGQRFQYQNVMYLVAGETIPQVSDQSWEDFTTTRILEPLEMTRSYATLARMIQAEHHNVASAHIRIDGECKKIPHYDGANIGPAGSMHSTARDMARWVAMLLRRGSSGSHRLLSEEDVQALRAPEIEIPPGDQLAMLFPAADSVAYGLGWITHEYQGQPVVEHGGTSDGMSSWVLWMPESDLGVVVLTNSLNGGLANAIAYYIVDDWLGRDPTSMSDSLEKVIEMFHTRANVARFRPTPQRRPASFSLDRCTGRFRSDLYGSAVIHRDTDTLTITLLGRKGVLHPNGDTGFRIDWGDDLFLAMAVPALRFTEGDDPSLDRLLFAGERWPRE